MDGSFHSWLEERGPGGCLIDMVDDLPEHNRRFARPPAKPEDYHRRAPRVATLDRIFRLESLRTIYNDWVVRYDNRFLCWVSRGGHIQVIGLGMPASIFS